MCPLYPLLLHSIYNYSKRLGNRAAKRPNRPLTVLRDYTTNTDIPEFPATPAELPNTTPVGN